MRDEILAAVADGTPASTMLLQLTPRMDSAIKRSSDLAQDDIAFKDGEMRYLGVLVSVGDVTVSKLSLDASTAVRKVVEEVKAPVRKTPVRKTAAKAKAPKAEADG